MLKNYKVSVIVPNYNYAEYLPRTINSLINQTYKNLEIIIVDDGSTDDSIQKVNAIDDKRVLLISKLNGGVSSARNAGLRIASGDFIAFLDSDDCWEPEKIEEAIGIINREELDVVYSGVKIQNTQGEILSIIEPIHCNNMYELYKNNPGSAFIFAATSNCIIRTELTKGIFFNEKLSTSADWDYIRRILKFGKVGFNKKSQVKYLKHTNSMSQKNAAKYLFDNLLMIMILMIDIQKERPSLRDFLVGIRALANIFKGYIKNKLINRENPE